MPGIGSSLYDAICSILWCVVPRIGNSWLNRAWLMAVLVATAVARATPAPAFTAVPAAGTAAAQIRMGAAWYPEQWPEDRWEKDLALMEAAGMNVVRVGEFAWSALEPAEDHYDLEWLARAVRLAEKHHIAVVIGTPTDAPPAWLTSAHPQVLRVGPDGQQAEHGGRRQFSYSSPLYRSFCRDIATRLAERFGHDPNVIGWQIDNEYTDESFDPDTRAQFQDWLHRRYGSLDSLNEDWTTAYWSQTYSAWSQIPLNDKPGNPGLMLDHRRFVTDTWRSYQREQLEAIRAHSERRQFITTNIGGLGWSDNWDHYAITADLDVASWDPYVGQGHLDYIRHGASSDYVRGWKQQNFWVMETQPGFVNWAPVNTTLSPGEVRAYGWESVGHGADAILYWQWRSALNGQEQYHGALVGPDGSPLPLYEEVRQLGQELATASAALSGTTPRPDVAIVTTYESRWAIDFQPHSRNYDQQRILLDYYRALDDLTHGVDIVHASAPLDHYKLVLAPSLNVIPAALGEHLAEYVRNGGHLILGPRSGMKDEFNRLDVHRQPGPLVDALGGRVEQYYALDDRLAVSGEAGSGTASIWGEDLSAHDPQTRVILRYGASETWLSDRPAALRRTYGKGTLTYLGTVLDPAMMSAFVKQALDAAHVTAAFGLLPPDVELMRRQTAAGDRIVFILINHGRQTRAIHLPVTLQDVLAEGRVVRSVTLASQGVAVLEGSHAR
jgi:beta-galactosidase